MIAVLEAKMSAKKRASKRATDPRRNSDPKNGERKMVHELRFGVRTVESLKEDAVLLRKLVDDLTGALEAATEMGLKELHLDGVTKGDRAITLLKAFVPHVRFAVEKEGYRNL
jgi:hypothetical protein